MAEMPAGVRWHRADLLDPTQVRDLFAAVRPSHVLHLAWAVDPADWATSPAHVTWLQAGLELLRQAGEHGATRVVVAGTCAEYDWRRGLCAEGETSTPSTLYGTCKRALGAVAETYSQTLGFSCAWARIFFVFGPHEHPARLVPSVIRSILAGRPARCTDGHQQRDFLYVRDVGDALVNLLASDVSGPVNIASGQPVAVRDLVWRLADQLGGQRLLRFGDLERATDAAPLVVGDTRRLTAALKWHPRYTLDEGLRETVEWWKARLGQPQVQSIA
jgi:nucleoside-diphosphate-sugar epimerase